MIIIGMILALGLFVVYLKILKLKFIGVGENDSFSDSVLKRIMQVIVTIAYVGLAFVLISVFA